MAGLSENQVQVIHDNPLTNAFDDFRTTLKSAYPNVDDVREPPFTCEHLVSLSGECESRIVFGRD
jgi:hypothetical protein